MFYAISAVIISIISFVFSTFEMWVPAAFAADIERPLLALAAYSFCPMHKFREKIFISGAMAFFASVTIHNTLIYTGILQDWVLIIVSGIFIILFLLLFCARLLTKWDSMVSEKIEPGYLYEIIGRPKRDLQFIAFSLSGGKGGTWAHTDGVTCWYFNTTSKVKVAEPLNLDYLIGRKVIKIGVADDKAIEELNAGVGKPWALRNNCWFSI